MHQVMISKYILIYRPMIIYEKKKKKLLVETKIYNKTKQKKNLENKESK